MPNNRSQNKKNIITEQADATLYGALIEPFIDAYDAIKGEIYKTISAVFSGIGLLMFAWSDNITKKIMNAHNRRVQEIDKENKEALERIDAGLTGPDATVAFMMFAPEIWAGTVIGAKIKEKLSDDEKDSKDLSRVDPKKPESPKPADPSQISKYGKALAQLGVAAAGATLMTMPANNHDEAVSKLMMLFYGRNLLENVGRDLLKENQESNQKNKKFVKWLNSNATQNRKMVFSLSVKKSVKDTNKVYDKIIDSIKMLDNSKNLEELEKNISNLEMEEIKKQLQDEISKLKQNAYLKQMENSKSEIGSTFRQALQGATAQKEPDKYPDAESIKKIEINDEKQKQEANILIFKQLKEMINKMKEQEVPKIQKKFADDLVKNKVIPSSESLEFMNITMEDIKKSDPELGDLIIKTKNKYGIN